MIARFVLVLLVLVGGVSVAQDADTQAVMDALTGRRSADSLTPRQREALRMVLARQALPEHCQEVADAAEALEDAATDLTQCARRQDFSDDCSRQARDARDAADDYELAVADIEDGCE